MSNILLVDFYGVFIRNFCASPLLNGVGEPIGATVGTLISLSSAIEMFKPSRVILCYEGNGSKDRRKKINESYKSNRKTVKLNRQYGMSDEESRENKIQQMDALNEVLSNLPVYRLSVDKCEADDLIAYISLQLYRGKKKIIYSSDSDNAQLVREDIYWYSPTKKILFDFAKVKEVYNISNPSNFVIWKALTGDKSDNVKNVEGIGPKTIEKMFPFLYEDKEHLLEDVFTFSVDSMRDEENKLKDKYQKIVENKELLINNYKITQLQSSMLNPSDTEAVKEQLNKPLNFNVALLRLFIERNLMVTSLDVNRFINNLQYLKHVQ